jgi:tRNA nucleotidyltransferase (CCA-adding enzyme)
VRPDLLAHPSVARLREALAGVPGVWLVGGAVRDLLLGRKVVDLDVVVEGDGVAAARAAAGALGGSVREHDRFGTATVVAPDGFAFDVVTARAESYPAPGALPEVRAGTLEEDLARRDFTANAIALSLSDGALREHPGALEDLEARVLRILHPRSFLDDPTRLLRLVRYAARLGFAPDARTDALARDAIAAGAVGTVSGTRLGAEVLALCGEDVAIAALNHANEIGLTRALHACFDPRVDLARDALNYAGQGNEGAGAAGEGAGAGGEGGGGAGEGGGSFESRYADLKGPTPPRVAAARRDLVVLATSLTRCRERQLRAWLDEMGLSAAEREAVIAAALHAETLAERLRHAHKPSEVRHLVAGRPAEQLAVAAALGVEEPLRRWREEWSLRELRIDGGDVMRAGVSEGPAVGRALEGAWAEALDEGVDDREGQLAAALRAAEGE